MKTEKNSDKKNASRPGPGTAGTYVKENFVSLISFLVMFVLVSLLAFFRIATTNTISSYNLNDYEVGQVSDITIRANKSLPADYDNPVSVQKGEKVIRKGFPITEEGYAKLKRMAESSAYIDYRAFADSVIFLIMLGVLHFFLFSTTCLGRKPSGKEMITENAFFLFTYAVAVLGMKTVIFSSPYALGVILPVAFCAFLMAILFGQLDALYFALHAAFGVLNASGYQLVPFLYTLCISLSAARIVHKIERRIDIVFASLLQAVLSAVFLFVFKIIFSDNFGDGLLSLTGVAFNGFLSGILCLGFLTPLEYVLNSASVFRLMDLSDLNNPIMKKMLVTASGTYNHSVMVASLAEAACREIGANSLIARVGGFFHDIGKMDNPEYFVENQSGRENIHKDMTPSLSVSIIRSHVKKGLEKAREMRMPPQIVDIISDVNLAYSEHARRYLADCGLPKERTFVTGSPMAEVLRENLPYIEKSDVLKRLGLQTGKYILLSAHREENIDTEKNFTSLFTAINKLAAKYDMPILYSCHPRSKKRLEESGFKLDKRVLAHEPLGFHDYNALQMNAFAVVSDSGTLPEESSFYLSIGKPFPAVCIRTSTERPEALDKGDFVLAGIDEKNLLQAVSLAVDMNQNRHYGVPVPDYTDENVSTKVVKIIQSFTGVVDKMVWRK